MEDRPLVFSCPLMTTVKASQSSSCPPAQPELDAHAIRGVTTQARTMDEQPPGSNGSCAATGVVVENKREHPILEEQRRPRATSHHRQRYFRKDRAQVRIMHRHGVPYDSITDILGPSASTIKKFVQNDSDMPDDETKDYDYVDEEFKKQYPLETEERTARYKRRYNDGGFRHDEQGTEASLSPTKSSSPWYPPRERNSHPSKRQRRQSQAMRSRVDATTTSNTFRDRSQPEVAQGSSGEQARASGRISTPISISSGSQRTVAEPNDDGQDLRTAPTLLQVQRTQIKQPVCQPTLPPSSENRTQFVGTFLHNLDIDMSRYQPALMKCSLGTAEEVVPLVQMPEWTTDCFHVALAREIPQLTVLDRFVLVRGFQAISPDGTTDKGTVRLRLDEVPMVWTLPPVIWLTRLPLNFLPYVESFKTAGFVDLGKLFAIAGWSVEELQTLLRSAVPLKATHRHVLVRELKNWKEP